jgi:hypothetical protein
MRPTGKIRRALPNDARHRVISGLDKNPVLWPFAAFPTCNAVEFRAVAEDIMADGPDRQPPEKAPGMASLLAWLGYFLVVFAVAGLAIYFAADPRPESASGGPALATQQLR